MSLNTASAELTAVATPEWLELFDPQTSRVVYANTVRAPPSALARSGRPGLPTAPGAPDPCHLSR
ncbi:hypothetical protein GGI02_005432, partial [Coemansia sp. RSA 2322]